MGRDLPRVLHVSLVPGIHQGVGILHQLRLEREAALSLNLSWDTVLFAPQSPIIDALDVPNPAPRDLTAADETSLTSRARTNLRVKRSFSSWLKAVEEKYDILLLRYSVHDRRLAKLMSARQGMVGLVHHSCEIPELLGLDGLVGRARGAAETVVGRRTVREADVLLAVTSEIAEYELARVSPLPIPTLIYPNGGTNTPNPVIDRRGEVPELLFVASRFSPWQGLDLLLESLGKYDQSIVLHLVGTMSESDARRAESDSRIVVHGVADQEAIRRIAEPCWAGISSLATERQGLRVACPLKVREYFSMGLPAVGSHLEELPPDFPFYARTTPDIGSIVEKAREWRSISRTEIASYATSVVSKKRILQQTYNELTDLWLDRQRSESHG